MSLSEFILVGIVTIAGVYLVLMVGMAVIYVAHAGLSAVVRRGFLAHRRWRMARGRCVKCGYDLQGNVSRICSECGTTVDFSE